jgi:Prefoldin subunit
LSSYLIGTYHELQEGKSKANPFEDQGDDLEDEDEEVDGPKEPLKTTFELNDTLYAEAELEETDTVFLWLGVRVSISSLHPNSITGILSLISLSVIQANVMLSYSLPTAITLLRSKLALAESSLRTSIEDLDFLREQVTVMEVNTARVYNWDVKRRRERRERERGEAQGSGSSRKEIEGT